MPPTVSSRALRGVAGRVTDLLLVFEASNQVSSNARLELTLPGEFRARDDLLATSTDFVASQYQASVISGRQAFLASLLSNANVRNFGKRKGSSHICVSLLASMDA
eukprot:6131200-Pleurochrysis_carterae.AAC.3